MYKKDFPIFNQLIYGKPLVFLDTAASAQKPKIVLDAMYDMATKSYANVHRGIYYLSEVATLAFEESRKTVAKFINAPSVKDIIYTRGATDSINLIAGTFGKTLKAGDEIVLSVAEHHANLVPWQLLRDQTGVVLKFVNVDDDGRLDMDAFKKALSDKTKLVAMTQMSNVLGVAFPVNEIVKLGHAAGAKVLIDGCQGVVHMGADVQAMGCDFYAFSAHKLYGPTGLGVLYAPHELMDTLTPLQGGGDMLVSATLEKTVYAQSPARFEAGTPATIQAIGLMSAIKYMDLIGWKLIQKTEEETMARLVDGLYSVKGVKTLGNMSCKQGLVCFNIDQLHPQDVALLLDKQGIAVRVGHHCAQPITERFGVKASIRASIGLYNDANDIDVFIKSLEKAKAVLS